MKASWSSGDPASLATDVGPLIDREAFDGIRAAHVEPGSEGIGARILTRTTRPDRQRSYAPHIFDATSHHRPSLLRSTARCRDQGNLRPGAAGGALVRVRPPVIEQINTLGYGLTLGIQTRIDESCQYLARQAVGNIYVNRNIIGAVVGVQPFGGEGLSSTGPKAAVRFTCRVSSASRRSPSIPVAAGGNVTLMTRSHNQTLGGMLACVA